MACASAISEELDRASLAVSVVQIPLAYDGIRWLCGACLKHGREGCHTNRLSGELAQDAHDVTLMTRREQIAQLRRAVADIISVFISLIRVISVLYTHEIRLPLLHERTRTLFEIHRAEALAELLDLPLHAVSARFIAGIHRADGGSQGSG